MKRSQKLFQRAQRIIPAGVNSPVRAFRSVGGTPPFIQRGKGAQVWDADGQWRMANGRIAREKSRVMLLVHDDNAAVSSKLMSLVSEYKKAFEQESVLWETTPVCAAF